MASQTTLSSAPLVIGQDLLVDSTVQQHRLGSYAETADGRGFRYVLMGGTSAVPGKLYTASAFSQANDSPVGGLAVAAAAIGATQVTITTSTTHTANILAGGYLVTDVTPGQGQIYRIKGNTAVTSAANMVVYLDDPIIVALTTASSVVLTASPYSNVIVSPGGASTGIPVGIATYVITNANYGWLQTHGPSVVLSGVATSLSLPGVPVCPSASTAGSVIVSTAILPTIGWIMHLFTATEYGLVFLTID